MACSERDVVAYLNGGLDAEASSRFEQHLLGCEACWTAVRDDRKGRELAEQLRSLAPSGLRDRVRAGVELAAREHTRSRFRVSRTLAAVAAAAVVVAASATVAMLELRPSDPAVVSDVLALAAHSEPGEKIMRTYDGRRIELSTYRVEGLPVVVARSPDPFPMPVHAKPLSGAHGEPWVATRHEMTLLSLGRPSHVLIGSRMSPDHLLAVARSMGFSP